jgi:DNA repair protein RecN
MLKRLTINNYALIEALDINFPDGLIIITGETGAGKSILLGAISLLLGAKADTSIFNDISRNCVVEGEFKTDNSDSSESEFIIRRVISPNGRSRSFINDEPVTNATLSEISSKLIDIHGQHQHLLIAESGTQIKILDYFSKCTNLVKEYREINSNLKATKEKLAKVENEIAKANAEEDYKRFQLDKIKELNIKEGELAELENIQKQLANAEEVKEALNRAINLMQPMGISIVQSLKEIVQILSKYSGIVNQIEGLPERVESCRIECKDIEDEIEKILDNIIVSPERLIQIENRIGDIYSIMRKYNCSNEAELINLRGRIEIELRETEDKTEYLDILKKQLNNLEKERENKAEEISIQRKANVKKLEQTLEKRIRELEMPHAIFQAKLYNDNSYNENGKDLLKFMFSANGNEKVNELAKVASGGELSRITLSIKAMMAEYIGMPSMIFDEIDTGVSGKIADKMGNLIGELGEHMQIFAITHLPQIASKKGTHFMVYKEFTNGNAITKIKELKDKERVLEVARLLSGEKLSEAAIENAKYLLNQ